MTDTSEETTAEQQPECALSRRRFASAGLSRTALLALANRPAFGAICTPSGFVSYSPNNPSGVRHVTDGCGGWSPGAWKTPDSGSGEGSREDWITAGAYANPRPGLECGDNVIGNMTPCDPAGTLFARVFVVGGSLGTLHDVLLNDPGSLEGHAVAAWLNARFNEATGRFPGYMNSLDVVGLYSTKVGGAESYTTVAGTVIPMLNFDLQAFFKQTYY
jgi:hypothetical protein